MMIQTTENILIYLYTNIICKNSVTHMENKKLYLNPLQMMQRFYDDYGRSRPYETLENLTCKYARKKSSDTDKMTKFLNDYDKRQRGKSTITYSDLKNTLSKNTINNPNPFTPSRYEKNLTETSKRCYFKNTYTQSHPFLTSNHKITQIQQEKIKAIKTQPIQAPAQVSRTQNYKLMNPRESRRSMQEMKDTIFRYKSNRKQKMDKIRYNYLVNKCYNNHKLEQAFGQLDSKAKMSQTNTKERIFPTMSLKL